MPGTPAQWNHNTHYHRLILNAVPTNSLSALDVGCGDGMLSRDLRNVVPDVTGIDQDAPVLDRARGQGQGQAITWVHGDVLEHRFEQQFDLVASVATLHHVPELDPALARLAELTAPGGTVAIVGLARSSGGTDALYDLWGAVQHLWFVRKYGYWEHSAPTVWPPPHSYAEVRRSAERVLPGVRWTRLPLWRYALIWRKPA